MIDEDSVRATGQDPSAPPGGAVPIAVGPASGAGGADAAYGCYRAQPVPVDSDPLAQALHRAEVAEARIEETLCFLDQSTAVHLPPGDPRAADRRRWMPPDRPEVGMVDRGPVTMFCSKPPCPGHPPAMSTPTTVTVHARTQGVTVTTAGGEVVHRLDGRLHRVGGPALITVFGDREWRQYGRLHRVDGPAVEAAHGGAEGCMGGVRHRCDGPAVV